ncbi:MAG: polyprenyl synthetase family protein [Gemmatimonadota bacterium]
MLEAALPRLESLQALVYDRLAGVERMLGSMVTADFQAIDDVNEHILSSRGKLLRPTLLLLSNEVGGRPSEAAIPLGAVVELLHVATLVHDDAIDHSPQRRGMPTVNSRWTHQVAIIMGDYLYSRAVVEITQLRSVDAIRILAMAANRMTIGEMRQLCAHDTLGMTEEDYYRLCECKTASLMSAACELGALFGRSEYREPLRSFGHDLGMAFQIVDDLLDYTAESDVTGKPSGLDLREHKVTLPLIAALPKLAAPARALIEELFADPAPSESLVSQAVEMIEGEGGLEYSRRCAEEFGARARGHLAALPEEPSVQLLGAAVDYVLERQR